MVPDNHNAHKMGKGLKYIDYVFLTLSQYENHKILPLLHINMHFSCTLMMLLQQPFSCTIDSHVFYLLCQKWTSKRMYGSVVQYYCYPHWKFILCIKKIGEYESKQTLPTKWQIFQVISLWQNTLPFNLSIFCNLYSSYISSPHTSEEQ